MAQALSKDATNKTAYYAGRCTGDVVITVVGGVEFVYGLITTISGGSGSAAALATGIGIAAEQVTIAVTAEGVVTVVDGVNTIHYGITAFKKDADKGKEADSKAADNGRNTSAGEYAASSGGGGITSTIKENGKTVNFGHGGRHLEGTDLNVDAVNQALATEVSTLNLRTGQFHKGRIIVDGITIEYTSYGVAEGIINVGTYYPLQ